MNARACCDATHGMTYCEELCILIAADKVTEERPNWMRETLVARLLSVQHRLNPLHVYCRLLDRGISKTLAMSAGKIYELLLFISLSFLIKTLIHFRLLLTHQGLNGKEVPHLSPPSFPLTRCLSACQQFDPRKLTRESFLDLTGRIDAHRLDGYLLINIAVN